MRSKDNSNCIEFMIKEHSTFRKSWDILIFISIIGSLIIIPLETVYNYQILNFPIAFLYFIDALFIIDIVFNFFTSYMYHGVEVTNNKKTVLKYLKTYFIIDLIASIPIIYNAGNGSESFLMLYPAYRLLRIGRLIVIFNRWSNIFWTFTSHIRIVKFIIIVMLLIHWIACSWQMTAVMSNFADNSWIVRMGIDDSSALTQYMHSLYWTVITMTTVGYGDITPGTNIEYLFATITALIGASLYAFIIGNIASILSNLDAAKTRFKNRLIAVSQYMQQRDVPVSLNKKVKEYYEYLWIRYRGQREDQFFNDLPESLRTEIVTYMAKDFIETAPIFKSCSLSLKNVLLAALKQQTYPPDCFVVQEGEKGNEIIFIGHGEMIISSANGKNTHGTLKNGEYFGDISMILGEKRTASVKTLTYCDVFILHKDDFNFIKAEYPEFKDVLKKISSEKSDKVSELVMSKVIL